MLCPSCVRLIDSNASACPHCGAVVRGHTPNANDSYDGLSRRAGEQGEQWFQSLFGRTPEIKGNFIFAEKRIPSGRTRREIDLIVVTSRRLYLFEVKHWTGSVHLEGNKWVQERWHGQKVEHPNPLDAQREKIDVLLGYLKTKNIAIARMHVSQKVFFLKSSLEIAGSIAQDPDVLYPDKLKPRITDQAIIDYCLQQEQNDDLLSSLLEGETRRVFPQIVDELFKLRTWDQMFLHGDVHHRGDLRAIAIGNSVLSAQEQAFAPGLKMEIRWPRAGTGTITIGGEGPYPIRSDDTMLFHIAGERQPSRIPLRDIQSVIIG